MKVLVTGVTGFTGSHLAKGLLTKKHDVYGLVRDRSKLNGLGKTNLIPMEGDLTDKDAVARAVKGMDVVYHIAAAYRENLPLEKLRAVNAEGTRNIFEAAEKHGVKRVVHCSTVGVHGHVENPPANEDAPLRPYDDYQLTKLEGEQIAASYIKKGFPGVIFRPVGMYGPGDTRFLKLFRSIAKKMFIMFGNGKALYHLTYIDDSVRGIILCGEHPKAVGNTYIIAGPPATTLNELVGKIAGTLGVPEPKIRLPFSLLWTASVACESLCMPLGINPPLFRRRADWFRKDRSFDTSKINKDLGYAPRVGLDDGLKMTADWYRSNKLI